MYINGPCTLSVYGRWCCQVPSMIIFYLQPPYQHDATPLTLAVMAGKCDVIQLLIDHGADLELELTDGRTALFEAVWARNTPSAKRLLENGANVNHRLANGRTALIEAVFKRQRDMAELLLSYGADVNIAADWENDFNRYANQWYGFTALHAAYRALTTWKHYQMLPHAAAYTVKKMSPRYLTEHVTEYLDLIKAVVSRCDNNKFEFVHSKRVYKVHKVSRFRRIPCVLAFLAEEEDCLHRMSDMWHADTWGLRHLDTVIWPHAM